jgi:hypothetical protein
MKKKGRCCFCNIEYDNYGNDIRPLITTYGDRCCDKCNEAIVIPNRVKFWFTKIPDIWVIKDRASKYYYDVTVLPNSAVNFHSDYIKKFLSLEDAELFVKYNNLKDCDIIRIISREDD